MIRNVADRRVLIVDDDRQVRRVLGEFFAANGYTCRSAANGQEGLASFDAERPPLTVTDMNMPVMDGLELLKQARTMEPDAAILVLTGMGD
ncbi:MAG: response regulator, partial [Candidatus Rokubacteria bacterium]|nr:response regulator [Candidatus Rokubacteria bacterium]